MRIVGLVLLIAVVAVVGGTAFVDVPSIIIVFGLALATMLAAVGGEVGTAFRAAFTQTREPETLRTGLAAFEAGQSMALISGGLIGAMAGVVMMLRHLDDVAALGPGTAMCLVATLYSLLLGLGVFVPITQSIRQRLHDGPAAE